MKRYSTFAPIFLMAVMFAGCPKAELVRDFSDPSEFARNLFRIAREGTAREWGSQLTEARQAMGDPYIQTHFKNWSTMLTQLETSFGVPIEDVKFRLQDNGLEFQFDNQWRLLFRVLNENGALKINQD